MLPSGAGHRGAAVAHSLNSDLRAALNRSGEHEAERFGKTFVPGDKVMQIGSGYGMKLYNAIVAH